MGTEATLIALAIYYAGVMGGLIALVCVMRSNRRNGAPKLEQDAGPISLDAERRRRRAELAMRRYGRLEANRDDVA